MSTTIGRRLTSSSAVRNMQGEGIVSILLSDCTETTKAASLRRTLSADMSSRKWLAQSGFKNIASSLELAFSSPSANSDSSSWEEEEEYDGNKTTEEVGFRPEHFYIWSSILTDKTKENPSNLPPPYVHPLVKRSASSLSKQSLEICTESLGSETGSHGFSSYPASETGEPIEEEKQVQLETQPDQQSEKEVPYFFDEADDWPIEKQSYSNRKQSSSLLPLSFPPPLSSLARGDGPSIQMQSHRKDGRFVLEAVSSVSKNYFHAQRQDGRLLLAFANHSPIPNRQELVFHQDEHHVEELKEDIFFQHFEEDEDDEKEEEEEENQTREVGIVKEQAQTLSTGATNVGRSTIMVKKLTEEVVEVGSTVLAQSMPRTAGLMMSAPPATATATFLNINAYKWRSNPLISRRCPLPLVVNTTTKRDEMLPLACKQPWRSLFTWQTNCIATS